LPTRPVARWSSQRTASSRSAGPARSSNGLRRRVVQALEPHHRLSSPLVEGVALEARRHGAVAGEAAHAQRRRRRLEVVGGERQQALRGVHERAQFHAAVPHRVPDRLGDLAHGGIADLRRVEQHHVDVAARAQHAARVATDGEEGPSRRQALGEALEPRIRLLRESAGESAPGEVGVADHLGARTTDHRCVDGTGHAGIVAVEPSAAHRRAGRFTRCSHSASSSGVFVRRAAVSVPRPARGGA
jgi:hypothetical protein